MALWSFCLGRSITDKASMRRKRKQELYAKQQRIDAIINWTAGLTIFGLGLGLLFIIFYFIGAAQGKW